MTDVLLYFLGAAYLSGFGTAFGLFGLLVHRADQGQAGSCIFRAIVASCGLIAIYLAYQGAIRL